MELETVYWIVGSFASGIGLMLLVKQWGHKEGTTEENLKHREEVERTWNVRFDALHNNLTLYQAQTNERIEKVLERLNEALLSVAREHATKSDLHAVEQRLVDRLSEKIDIAVLGRSSRRKTAAE